MNINTIHPIPTWLTPEERKLYNKQKNPLLKYLKQHKIELDPFLATKIHLYLNNYIYLHRAENTIFSPNVVAGHNIVVAGLPTEPQPPTKGLPSQISNIKSEIPSLSPAHLEILAKNNERLRKNFNELHAFIQEYIKAKLAQGPQNFLDFYAQLLKDDAELDKKEAEEAAKLAQTPQPGAPISSPVLSPSPSHLQTLSTLQTPSPSSTPMSDPSDWSDPSDASTLSPPSPSTPKYFTSDKSLVESRKRQEQDLYEKSPKVPPKTPPVLLPWQSRR